MFRGLRHGLEKIKIRNCKTPTSPVICTQMCVVLGALSFALHELCIYNYDTVKRRGAKWDLIKKSSLLS